MEVVKESCTIVVEVLFCNDIALYSVCEATHRFVEENCVEVGIDDVAEVENVAGEVVIEYIVFRSFDVDENTLVPVVDCILR